MIDPSRSAAQPSLAKLQDLDVKPGALRLVDILHDDDCPKLRGGRCSCAPIVRPLNCQERRAQKGGER
jgi:hypothetical protein